MPVAMTVLGRLQQMGHGVEHGTADVGNPLRGEAEVLQLGSRFSRLRGSP
jgi:hypothetical protein